MNTAAKLAAFVAAVGLVLAGGWAIGAAAGPQVQPAPSAHQASSGGHGQRSHGGHEASLPGGLAAAQDGYTFAPLDSTLRANRDQQFRFRILGPDGHAVTSFEVEHEKRLHLIVVRRDSVGFQHLHPTMAADGTWSVPLRLDKPGSYRAFADFRPAGGEALTLGVDLAVPGSFAPETVKPSREATVDGYRVKLDGELKPGASSELTLTVTRDGRPVTDLQQYLGAAGHLVALRLGDLAYLHVHPVDPEARGPQIHFAAEAPSAGVYRLYLDFQHRGKVRTVEFTASAEGHHG